MKVQIYILSHSFFKNHFVIFSNFKLRNIKIVLVESILMIINSRVECDFEKDLIKMRISLWLNTPLNQIKRSEWQTINADSAESGKGARVITIINEISLDRL
jgi:hypothetical protein